MARRRGEVVAFRRPAPGRRPASARGRSRARWTPPLLPTLLALALAGLVAFGLARSPWPVGVTLRHWAAVQHCDLARLVRLAPSHRGTPGYAAARDADSDGIACEPVPVGSLARVRVPWGP